MTISRIRHFLFRSVLPRVGHEPHFHMNLAERGWPRVSALTSRQPEAAAIESVDCGPKGYDEKSGTLEEYAKQSRPVVLKGYVRGVAERWSPDVLKAELGDTAGAVRVGDYDESAGAPTVVKMSVSDFIDHLLGKAPFPRPELIVDGKGPYLANATLPKLAARLPKPGFFTGVPNTTFWLGAAGITPLHCHVHCDVVLTQLIGRRRVMLVPPHQATLVGCIQRNINICTATFDPFEPDRSAFPGTDAVRKLYYELDAGDALLIPGFWFHAVRLNTFSLASSQFNDHLMPLSIGGGPRGPWLQREYAQGWG